VGLLLRGLYGYRDYLVKKRGIVPGRIEVVAGGNKDKITTTYGFSSAIKRRVAQLWRKS
jgi:hypothetical protein